MRRFYQDFLDGVSDHWVVTGLAVIAIVLFLAYTLLG
jgi:hypothetical protein